jgi:hypothetical protein
VESSAFCLDDIHPGNFRKDESGQLFALDFGNTNFLPSAFQDLAFDGRSFALKVRDSLGYSISNHRGALRLAAGRLHLFNDSSHGKLLDWFIFARMFRNG